MSAHVGTTHSPRGPTDQRAKINRSLLRPEPQTHKGQLKNGRYQSRLSAVAEIWWRCRGREAAGADRSAGEGGQALHAREEIAEEEVSLFPRRDGVQ